jgi:poly(A) polymerase
VHSDSDVRRGARRVVATLRRAGFDAWFVGGCVRDRLLGRPVNEYDIATSARPDDVVKVFPRTIGVGAQFGVIVVLDRDGQFEVATFRAEAAYTDGRRPDTVRFVSAREDVLRRDFTINGLLEDPETGDIADFVNGRKDLAARVIRAIGDPVARFEEDHLRMLRAVRFAATLRFELDEDTADALRHHAAKVAGVAAERVQAELRKAFQYGDPNRALTLLADSGLLSVILPEHGPLEFLQAALRSLGPQPLAQTLAVLLAGRGEGVGRTVADRLKLSREDREQLLYALALSERHTQPMTHVERIRLVREPRFTESAPVERALIVARDGAVAPLDDLIGLLESTPPERLSPPRLIDGTDLRTLGMKPGPAFKTLLDAIEDNQIEGRITSRDEALAFAAAYYAGDAGVG